MQTTEPLIEGNFYHIYNRGINGEDIFKKEENYSYFLQQYAKYVAPVVDTYAYCLLKNHFHLMIRLKDFSNPSNNLAKLMEAKDWKNYPDVSKQFSHFFNSYAQSINAAFSRTGGLFETSFKRNLIDDEQYFNQVTYYIHANPQKHGFVLDFRNYPYSSYKSHLSEKPTMLMREELLEWFGSRDSYIAFHDRNQFTGMEEFILNFD
jgi:putative transposase